MKPWIKHALLMTAGGLITALVTARPLVDAGLAPSDWIDITISFLTGSGLAALPSARAIVAGVASD